MLGVGFMTPNIDNINDYFDNIDIYLRLKPVGSGGKLYWLYDEKHSYAVKVTKDFVDSLEELTEPAPGLYDIDNFLPLFDDAFLESARGAFKFFPRVGFLAKDYAEFYLDYAASDISHFSNSFFVGSVKVSVSQSSHLLWFLCKQFEDDYIFDINENLTLKLKGTSVSSVEDDLCAALVYLGFLCPSEYNGDYPSIGRLNSEDDLWSTSNYEIVSGKSSLSRPTHPIALRYFWQARQLFGEVSILYYYKVLEHFFDVAWQRRIKDLIDEANGNSEVLAHLLGTEQPRNEEQYLGFVLSYLINDELWDTIVEARFSSRDVDALARAIYKVRNEIAHGKNDERLSIVVPNIIPEETLHEQIRILEALAITALTVFGNVEPVPKRVIELEDD